MILRPLVTFKDWLLSGPAKWALVPGRSGDAACVRALVLRPKDIMDAAELLVLMHQEHYPEARGVDLRPIWSHSLDPKTNNGETQTDFDFADLATLSPGETRSLMVSAYGAIIEFGNATPATVYWGDDPSKRRVEAAYELLRKRGRARIQVRRLTRTLFVVALVAAGAITSAVSLWE